jgi:hypothetical protein
MPEPVHDEPVAAAVPAVEPPRTFPAPAFEAVATVLPVVPVLPPQQLPEPAREEPVLVAQASPAPARVPVAKALAAPPVAAPAPLPFAPPVEPVVAVLSQPDPVAPLATVLAPLAVSSGLTSAASVSPQAEATTIASETARLKDVLASLSAPVAPVTRPAEAVSPAEPLAPATLPAAPPRPAAPMVASLAPSGPDPSRSPEPAGLKSEWRAAVPASTDIRVSNGTGRRLMATRFASYFRGHGLFVRKIANANSFDYRRTVIFYNPDQRANAEALAAVLPFPVRLAEAKQGRGQIELVLGFDLLGLDDALRSA